MRVKLFRCAVGVARAWSMERSLLGLAALLGLLGLSVLLGCAECTHIFALDEDFSKLKSDQGLVKHVEHVLKRLKTFKVAVHPRVRLFYHLLKRGMADHAHRTADSLYLPYVYRQTPAY